MESLFVALLNMSIGASIAAALVIALRLIFRKVPKKIHVALWLLVAIKLICPFSFESSYSLMPSQNLVKVSTRAVEQVTDVTDDALIESDAPTKAEISDVGTTEKVGTTENVGTINNQKPVSSTKKGLGAGLVMAYIWLIGVGVIAAYNVMGAIMLKKRIASAVKLEENIYRCDTIRTSFVSGIIKPKVYLADNVPIKYEQYVLDHELSHIRRRDNDTKFFGFVLMTIYWFNPIMWVAYRLFCDDIEQACDELAVEQYSLSMKKEYSRALLESTVSSLYDEHRRLSFISSAFSMNDVKRRVTNVLKSKKITTTVIAALVVAIILSTTAIMFTGCSKDGGNNLSKSDVSSQSEVYTFTHSIVSPRVDAATAEKWDSKVKEAVHNNIIPNHEGDVIIWSNYNGIKVEENDYLDEQYTIFSVKDISEDKSMVYAYVRLFLFKLTEHEGNTFFEEQGDSIIEPTAFEFTKDKNGEYQLTAIGKYRAYETPTGTMTLANMYDFATGKYRGDKKLLNVLNGKYKQGTQPDDECELMELPSEALEGDAIEALYNEMEITTLKNAEQAVVNINKDAKCVLYGQYE